MSDLQTTISSLYRLYHKELGYSAAAAMMACFRHIQMRHGWREIFTNAVMAGLLAAGVESLLTTIGVHSSESGWFIACVIGYLGVGSIMSRFDSFCPQIDPRNRKGKPEVEAGNDATHDPE